MYCIKCGKTSQKSEILCEECGIQSGFGDVSNQQIKKKKKYGMYLGFLGNLLILIGLFSSFILVKLDAPVDYAAEIFKERTWGPIETAEATENTQTDDSEEGEEEKLEEKGYSFSIMEYLTRRTPDEEKDTEDIAILQKVITNMQNQGITSLDMEDEELADKVLSQYVSSEKDEVKKVLDYYNETETSGMIIIVVAVIALGVACGMIIRKDYKWSMLFSFIGISPVWVLMYRLSGIVSWDFESGMYYFVGGIFAVLLGGLISENTDRCPKCAEELPGGAVFCSKCGFDMKIKKVRKTIGERIPASWYMPMSVIGNILVFVGILVPVIRFPIVRYPVAVNEPNITTSIIGLMNSQIADSRGWTGMLTLLIVVICLLLIGAVVMAIFEKSILSIGASVLAMAVIVLTIFKVQEVIVLFTPAFFLLPIGLILAVYAGVQKFRFMSKASKTKGITKM